MTAVIETQKLTKSYGAHRGIDDVDLVVDEGEVFGFLGPNGAGKTTTIRTLLDHIRPTHGQAFVFGIETTADPVAIHRRIGYLPGEFALYDKLTGGQTIDYFANLRGGVDAAYQRDLIARLDLDPSRRFKEYSKGNKQKVGLVIALQHRPDLLILDEPTSGLDPLVQQTFFEVIREAKAEGRTVFLSSHILGEVEKTCDRVAIIREGRLVKVDRVEALRDLAHHQVELRFAGDVPSAAFAALAGVSDVNADDHVLRLRVSGSIAPVVREAARYELVDFVSREPSLEETFLAQYGNDAGQAAGHGRDDRRQPAARQRAVRCLAAVRPGTVFGKTMRDSRRATIIVGVVLGPAPDQRARGHRDRVRHARLAPGAWRPRPGRATDPPGPCRQAGQRRDAGRLPPVQVRLVLPDHPQPLVDPRPVRHARRGGDAGQPRVRGRDADLAAAGSRSRNCPGTSS